MSWLPRGEMEEWVSDPMVLRYRDRLLGRLELELRRLRAQARTGTLEEVRRAEAKAALLDEILRDFEFNEEQANDEGPET